ncbi:hypothetical protein [Levilactobacillus mulengensis]|uniref:hypothetical protein n=1 Tax=Levilactobacillus mulengensis TaxID=2486025 RepID=UPI000F7A519F|nr:hypothetical protein [Levilactobacillus mulengensis]
MNNQPNIDRIIQRLEDDYQSGQLRIFLHKKSKDYLKAHRLTIDAMIQMAISQLSNNHYYRGPSPHHWKAHLTVYEFITMIDDSDMYIKFDIGPEFSQIESFHSREKPINFTWTYH